MPDSYGSYSLAKVHPSIISLRSRSPVTFHAKQVSSDMRKHMFLVVFMFSHSVLDVFGNSLDLFVYGFPG